MSKLGYTARRTDSNLYCEEKTSPGRYKASSKLYQRASNVKSVCLGPYSVAVFSEYSSLTLGFTGVRAGEGRITRLGLAQALLGDRGGQDWRVSI